MPKYRQHTPEESRVSSAYSQAMIHKPACHVESDRHQRGICDAAGDLCGCTCKKLGLAGANPYPSPAEIARDQNEALRGLNLDKELQFQAAQEVNDTLRTGSACCTACGINLDKHDYAFFRIGQLRSEIEISIRLLKQGVTASAVIRELERALFDTRFDYRPQGGPNG